jgi:glycosyltransferase involved in cell wall biosynthesis
MGADTRPNVLVFTGYYLPGYKAGGILRSVINAVSHFHAEFRFFIVTRDRDLGDAAPYPGVQVGAWQDVGPARVLYLPPGGESLSRIREIVTGTPHDLIRLNSFFDPLTVKVLLNRKAGRIPRTPIVLSPFGEFAWPSLCQKYPKKAVFIRAARLFGLYAPVVWHASNSTEAKEIGDVMGVPESAIRVAEDLPTVWDREPEDPVADPTARSATLRVAFFSRVSPEKNLDFALSALANVRNPVDFDVIGPIENVPYWERCQELIRALPTNVTARSLGSITPDQVLPTLSQYDVMFLPTGGEGYGHVIAESLTAGTPVLISTLTPWRDLQARGLGWDLPLDDDVAPFVRVLEAIGVPSSEDRAARRAAVKAKMRQHLRDSPNVHRYREMLTDVIDGRTSASAKRS